MHAFIWIWLTLWMIGIVSEKRSSANKLNRSTLQMPSNCYPVRIYQNKTILEVSFVNHTLSCVHYLPVNVTKLDFSRSPIRLKQLDEEPFVHLNQLTVLSLQKNGIQIIQPTVFKGLEQLNILFLNGNMIKTLHEDLFLPCPNLTEINLSNNIIITFKGINRALGKLPRLQNLYLWENVILNNIGEKDLEPLAMTNLTFLDLGACQMKFVDPRAFFHLKSLCKLNLGYSYFDNTDLSYALESLPNTSIDILDLRGLRKLSGFPDEALSKLSKSNIRHLILSVNNFEEIGQFPSIPSLKKLDLSNSRIRTIRTGAFANLSALENLDLSRNYLFYLYPPSLGNLTRLKKLDVSYNHDILGGKRFLWSNRPFASFPSLQTLDMTRVNLIHVSNSTFYGLHHLKELYLAESRIEMLDDFSFLSLNSLEVLQLDYNPKLTLNTNSFIGLKSLKSLFLLRTFTLFKPEELILHHLPHLQVLDLSRTMITRIPAHEFVNLPSLTILRLRDNRLVPWENSVFFMNSNLTYINLADNNFATITSAMIEDFNNLKTLDVSANPFNCSSCGLSVFSKWINETGVDLLNIPSMKCVVPEELYGKSLLQVEFDHCLVVVTVKNPTVLIATTAITFCLILIIAGVVSFYYRWHIRHWCFLLRAKRQKCQENGSVRIFLYDAFVSYSVHDRPWILAQLIPKLEKEEPIFKLCLHERDFEIGREIIYNIVDAIDASRKIIFILTNHFLRSQWCTWEANMTQFKFVEDQRDAIILVVLETLDKKLMSSRLKFLISTCTYLPWPQQPSAEAEKLFWERLRQALKIGE